MLKEDDLLANYAGVVEVGGGIYRCEEATRKSTYYYYLKLSNADKAVDVLMVSENLIDDNFVVQALDKLSFSSVLKLQAIPLITNAYGFSDVMLVPSDYHSYFKGVFGSKRDNVIFCMPIHRSEFSGNETIDEFALMRRETVDSLNWRRDISPKIIIRFDNPKTQAGTGKAEVLVKYEHVLQEIENLNGVQAGFLEIINYEDRVIEILSSNVDEYTLIRNRDDNTRISLKKPELLKSLWSFLTS